MWLFHINIMEKENVVGDKKKPTHLNWNNRIKKCVKSSSLWRKYFSFAFQVIELIFISLINQIFIISFSSKIDVTIYFEIDLTHCVDPSIILFNLKSKMPHFWRHSVSVVEFKADISKNLSTKIYM